MKKMILSVVFLLSLSSSLFAIKETKIIRVGYANFEEIAAKLNPEDRSINTIKELRDSYDKQIQSLQSDVDNLRSKLGNSPSEGSINDLVKEYNNKSIELEILKASAQSDVARKTKELLVPIRSRIESLIAQKAKQLGFDIIIDSSMVMIGKSNLDITKTILASL